MGSEQRKAMADQIKTVPDSKTARSAACQNSGFFNSDRRRPFGLGRVGKITLYF
jgi:hypothetical protein